MPNRGKLDEPGFMEGILEEVRSKPVEYWLEKLARYENEKPGDIILPGVPGRTKKSTSAIAASSAAAETARKTPRKNRKAA